MSRLFCAFCVGVICIVFVGFPSACNQKDRELEKLCTKLNAPETTDQATAEAIQLAANDPIARDYIVGRLPALIVQVKPHQAVWQNAVKLAGQLRAEGAIPVLLQVLPQSPRDTGMISLTAVWGLGGDPVGKALWQIGDPAVPGLADLLAHGDERAKWRALGVLWNIDSAASRKAIQDDIPRQTNLDIKSVIPKLVATGPQSPTK